MLRVRTPHTLVYWPPAGVDSFGVPKTGTPIVKNCRWNDTIQETIAPNNTNVLSSGQIFLAEEVLVGGFVYQIPNELMVDGWELSDLVDASAWLDPPQNNRGVREILSVSKSDSIKGDQWFWKAMVR